MGTLWYFNIAVENHHFWWENLWQITTFNSYVKLPKGKLLSTAEIVNCHCFDSQMVKIFLFLAVEMNYNSGSECQPTLCIYIYIYIHIHIYIYKYIHDIKQIDANWGLFHLLMVDLFRRNVNQFYQKSCWLYPVKTELRTPWTVELKVSSYSILLLFRGNNHNS